jgi:hypothetical protein
VECGTCACWQHFSSALCRSRKEESLKGEFLPHENVSGQARARDESNFMTLLRLCEADCVNPEKEAKKLHEQIPRMVSHCCSRLPFDVSTTCRQGEEQQQDQGWLQYSMERKIYEKLYESRKDSSAFACSETLNSPKTIPMRPASQANTKAARNNKK